MGIWDDLFSSGEIDQTISVKCKQGRIQLCFSFRGARLKSILGAAADGTWFKNCSPGILPQITNSVQIIIKGNGQISARFTAAECAKLLDKKWPNKDDFERLRAAVLERKQYPSPKDEIPGGGGKSMTAQGQTKKPGSHSSDRHS